MTSGESPFGRSEREHYADVFRALSEPARIELLVRIAQVESMPASDLEDVMLSRSTLSYHMKVLTQAGLISVHKSGRNVFYEARQDVLEYFVPDLVRRLAQPMYRRGQRRRSPAAAKSSGLM